MIRLFIGFDPREALAFHTFLSSALEHSTVPLAVTPLTEMALGTEQRDGSNSFTYSRFLVPQLCEFDGWAIFVDGDMVLERDIAQLYACRDDQYAVQVVKHDYRTRHPSKYIGSTLECPNPHYPSKNWSSVILWNCKHPSNRVLTKEYVDAMTGAHLHRFAWLKSNEVGQLSSTWNHLVSEDPPGDAALRHYTLGIPGIKHYADDYSSWKWHLAMLRALECAGENPLSVIKRAQERIGAAR